MSECADLTYYQKNKDVILNRVKYYKRKWQREEETYLKKNKIKKKRISRK